MSQLVKMKRQAYFKDFKRFGAFKGIVEQKNVAFNSFLCKLGFFGTRGPLIPKKSPIYIRTSFVFCGIIINQVLSQVNNIHFFFFTMMLENVMRNFHRRVLKCMYR
jgi:hypothetical protein